MEEREGVVGGEREYGGGRGEEGNDEKGEERREMRRGKGEEKGERGQTGIRSEEVEGLRDEGA